MCQVLSWGDGDTQKTKTLSSKYLRASEDTGMRTEMWSVVRGGTTWSIMVPLDHGLTLSGQSET